MELNIITKMKKILKSILLLSVVSLSSCDKGFDELNVNKTAATAINPVFTLNTAILNLSQSRGTIQYEVSIVQQMVTPNEGVLAGANFNQDNRDVTVLNWQRLYRNVVRHTYDVINTTSTLPNRSNLNAMARIIKAQASMVLTDTYGDVPYSEAGKGYIDQIKLPRYDTQQAIYTDIIKELEAASAALDASKTKETGEVLYGGDVAKWKKLANSLLLRAGMRLVKVDANLAKTTVAKALAGGVISANADNAVIKHDANYVSEFGQMLNSTEAANFYLAAPFVNFLKTTKDPRLKSIAVRYVGAGSGSQQIASRASIDPAVQKGMPFGFNNSGIVKVATDSSLASFYDFTQADRNRICKTAGPAFIVTAAQTQLLVAEAIERGWATGKAEDHYIAAVKANMAQMGDYDAASAVPAADVDAYLTANPYTATKAMEQINTQYWVASFLNGNEAFANFRRSGFPVLKPNPFAGKSIKGDFIRRLTYPNSEISVNSANVKEAIARQGADDLDTRVWWDKQ
jgi:hypothetical protein